MPSATILAAVLCEVSLLGRGKEQTPNPYRPVQLCSKSSSGSSAAFGTRGVRSPARPCRTPLQKRYGFRLRVPETVLGVAPEDAAEVRRLPPFPPGGLQPLLLRAHGVLTASP